MISHHTLHYMFFYNKIDWSRNILVAIVMVAKICAVCLYDDLGDLGRRP